MKQRFLVAADALLVSVVWIHYAWEQRTLPRAWARTAQPMRLEPGKLRPPGRVP